MVFSSGRGGSTGAQGAAAGMYLGRFVVKLVCEGQLAYTEGTEGQLA